MNPSRRVVALAVAAAAALLLIPLPVAHRLWSVPMDLGHLVLGGGLTLLAYLWIARRRPGSSVVAGAFAWLAGTGVLALLEVGQALTGRSASLHDLVSNGLGATAALLGILAWTAPGRRPAAWLGMLVPLAIGAVPPAFTCLDAIRQDRAWPLLAGMESMLELTRLGLQDVEVALDDTERTQGRRSLRVRVPPHDEWPGVSLRCKRDWRGFEALLFDVHVPDPAGLRLYFKVADVDNDQTWDAWFNWRADLPPGWSTHRIPLADVERGPKQRPMKMAEITGMQWYVSRPETPVIFRIDNVRLE